ncbi:MAG TPA: ATP-binding protein [Flavisolibacter sp.]|nr:ATP-binding protein [Flavisolibacter sp.]
MVDTKTIDNFPQNEAERVEALYRYNLLDILAEETFNNVARLMADAFDVPIALVSVVDKNRVFFKGSVGIRGINYTDRDVSLCSFAILSSRPTIFDKPLQEPCLLTNPFVHGDSGWRFYAGAPLVTPDGFHIGTVSVIDKKERTFSSRQKDMLEQFARVVMNEMELRRVAIRQKLAEEELENKAGERTRELEKLNAELKRTNRNLEEFAYAASHDLKEPVRKIQVFAGRIKESLGERMSEQEKLYFERMELASRRMGTLIDDLLTYSEVSQHSTTVRPVDMNNLIDQVLHDLDLEIEQKGAIIHRKELCSVTGHPRQLQQAFQNLIQNALKYGKPGLPPEITIGCIQAKGADLALHLTAREQAGNYCRICVTDNGIGFAQEDAERIFNVFTRLHGNAEYKGTGVGLSIVRKVVQNHGGFVWAESAPGEGANFVVLLPAD